MTGVSGDSADGDVRSYAGIQFQYESPGFYRCGCEIAMLTGRELQLHSIARTLFPGPFT